MIINQVTLFATAKPVIPENVVTSVRSIIGVIHRKLEAPARGVIVMTTSIELLKKVAIPRLGSVSNACIILKETNVRTVLKDTLEMQRSGPVNDASVTTLELINLKEPVTE